jgi:hypothetical protein
MKHEDADRLLDRIGMLRHPCDLDLLLFVARHPRTLITSKQIAAWLGYELKQIADSLEVLLEGGLRTRRQNPTHAARMYVFAIGGTAGGWQCCAVGQDVVWVVFGSRPLASSGPILGRSDDDASVSQAGGPC